MNPSVFLFILFTQINPIVDFKTGNICLMKKIKKLWYKLQKNYRNERDPKRFSLASIFYLYKKVFNKHCKKLSTQRKHWHKKDGRRVTNYEICFKQFTQLILQKHKLMFSIFSSFVSLA